MTELIDLSSPRLSLQRAVQSGIHPLKGAMTDPALFVVVDEVNDKNRFTCFRFKDGIVTAFVTFIELDLREGETYLQIGYEVPEHLRGQGRAKDVVEASIAELKHFLAMALDISTFYIEAIIDEENAPSRRVALACISATPNRITDAYTGRSSYQYLRRVGSVG